MEMHLTNIRREPLYAGALIIVYIESNMSFIMAGKIKSTFKNAHFEPILFEARDPKGRGRTGVWTAHETKMVGTEHLQRALISNTITTSERFISQFPMKNMIELEKQMRRWRFEKKEPTDLFGQTKVIVTGKGPGEKDDIVTCVMLVLYWSWIRRTDPDMRLAASRMGWNIT